MRTIQFTERREFDYGDGLVVHEAGSEATLRDDKAQRWVTRGAAHYVQPSADVPKAPEPTEAELQTLVASAAADEAAIERAAAEEAAEGADDDNAMGSAADVHGADGGGDGQRAVDVAGPGRQGAGRKPSGGRHK